MIYFKTNGRRLVANIDIRNFHFLPCFYKIRNILESLYRIAYLFFMMIIVTNSVQLRLKYPITMQLNNVARYSSNKQTRILREIWFIKLITTFCQTNTKFYFFNYLLIFFP